MRGNRACKAGVIEVPMATLKELQDEDEEPVNEIAIGEFTLSRSKTPGKLWMTNHSGQRAEVDEKVLEDVLKSFF